MTNPPGLLSLAERVERATGADRELDAEIEIAIDPSNNGRVIYGKGRRFYMGAAPDRVPFAVRFGTGTKFGLICQNHSYTASLDAAMTLVPEGWAKYVAEDEHGCHACVWDLQTTLPSGGCKDAATPALALCAAALRARASSDAGGRG